MTIDSMRYDAAVYTYSRRGAGGVTAPLPPFTFHIHGQTLVARSPPRVQIEIRGDRFAGNYERSLPDGHRASRAGVGEALMQHEPLCWLEACL
jgi:hypothetical protein